MNKIIIAKDQMFLAFKLMGQEALAMNHYDLQATDPTYSAEEWKIFLSEPDIQDYIKKEMQIIRKSQMNKIVQESADSRSVGQAQLLGTLQKMDEDNSEAEGPVFIYCHVPLNSEQAFAPNVMEVDELGHPKV